VKKLIVIAFCASLVLTACGGSSKDGGDGATVIRRFCLPGSDGKMWEHVDLSDGRIGVPTGATC